MAGQVTHLADAAPASAVLDQVPTDIAPHRILRFASPCSAGCAHHRADRRALAEGIVTGPAEPEPAAAPHCHLRHDCGRWQQTGLTGCARCPALTERPAGAMDAPAQLLLVRRRRRITVAPPARASAVPEPLATRRAEEVSFSVGRRL